MADDWRRLANYVRARRTALGWFTAQDFADATGLTRQTISTLENGRKVRGSTLARLENALAWKPGSAQAILDGGEPEPADEQHEPGIELYDDAERAIWAITELTDQERRGLIAYYRANAQVQRPRRAG